jgi:hypothetical protein
MTTKKKSSFRGKVAADAQRRQKAATSYGHLSLPKGVSVFSPEPGGRVKLDFMPYIVTDPKHPDRNEALGVAMPDTPWYTRPYSIHRNVGANNDSYVCLASIGKKCPICEYRAKRIKAQAEKEETDTMKPSKRNLYLVIPLDSKKHEAEVHIFDISTFNFQNLLDDELKENEDYEVFPDLTEGYTLKVRFDSKTIGGSQPFAQASRIDFLDRDEAYDEALLDDMPNLDEVLIILSYDELKAKFFEMEGEEDGGKLSEAEEEEDEKPVRRHKVLHKEKEEPEEEEDEKPTRKPIRGTPSTKPRNRREEPEEEEEDEKPTRSTHHHTSERSSEKKGKCPHGHKFGTDHEEFDECEDCKSWDLCLEEKEK